VEAEVAREDLAATHPTDLAGDEHSPTNHMGLLGEGCCDTPGISRDY
jgi:hypothetical protein